MTSAAHLQGKTALVTGAGRGIGAAIAAELAALGCHVVLVGRNAERLQATEAAIQANGHQATALAADVCSSDWLIDLIAQHGSIDLFVHCAAAFADYGPLEQVAEDAIDNVIETGLTAAIKITAALLPGMKQNNYGRLLFIGSRAASTGAANQVVYATAKGALESLVKSLTLETAHTGITANLIEPGLIDTERTAEAMTDSAREKFAALTPAGRMGTPQEVAAAVRYLVSEESDFVRGITLRIDGGLGLGLASASRKPR